MLSLFLNPMIVILNTKSNERLEFVGDGVLECITKYELYRRFLGQMKDS